MTGLTIIALARVAMPFDLTSVLAPVITSDGPAVFLAGQVYAQGLMAGQVAFAGS